MEFIVGNMFVWLGSAIALALVTVLIQIRNMGKVKNQVTSSFASMSARSFDSAFDQMKEVQGSLVGGFGVMAVTGVIASVNMLLFLVAVVGQLVG